jgi:LmbE family N-acetylglucosaminyl deacetylase
MKTLILVAHPDDEIIMCGGTIDKLVKKGYRIFVTYFSRNDQAFFAEETQNERRKRATNEAIKSSKLLHYQTNFLDFQDMQLEKDKGLLIQKIIKEIRRVKPDVIITHHKNDKHIDHRTLGSVVSEANFQSGCKLCGGNKKWKADLVLNGEVDLEMTTPFNYQVVSAISLQNIKNKLKAFICYESVSNEHKTSTNWLLKKIKVSAELRGKSIDCSYGEAFRIDNYSPININGIRRLVEILS